MMFASGGPHHHKPSSLQSDKHLEQTFGIQICMSLQVADLRDQCDCLRLQLRQQESTETALRTQHATKFAELQSLANQQVRP